MECAPIHHHQHWLHWCAINTMHHNWSRTLHHRRRVRFLLTAAEIINLNEKKTSTNNIPMDNMNYDWIPTNQNQSMIFVFIRMDDKWNEHTHTLNSYMDPTLFGTRQTDNKTLFDCGIDFEVFLKFYYIYIYIQQIHEENALHREWDGGTVK